MGVKNPDTLRRSIRLDQLFPYEIKHLAWLATFSHAPPAFIRAAALEYLDSTGTYVLRTRSSSIANLARFASRWWPLQPSELRTGLGLPAPRYAPMR